jgi:hypothetical protein
LIDGVLNVIECPSYISKNMDVDDGKESSSVNPATVHAIAAVGCVSSAGITAVAKVRTSTPRDDVNETDMLTFEGLRLEQEAECAFASKALKRNPFTDIILKECELSVTAALKDTVKAILLVFATQLERVIDKSLPSCKESGVLRSTNPL